MKKLSISHLKLNEVLALLENLGGWIESSEGTFWVVYK